MTNRDTDIIAVVTVKDKRVIIRRDEMADFPLLYCKDIVLGCFADEEGDICFLPDKDRVPKKGITTFTNEKKFWKEVKGYPVLYLVADKYGFMSASEVDSGVSVGAIAWRTKKSSKVALGTIRQDYPELFDAAEQLKAWYGNGYCWWQLQTRKKPYCKICGSWQDTAICGDGYYGDDYLVKIAGDVHLSAKDIKLAKAVQNWKGEDDE